MSEDDQHRALSFLKQTGQVFQVQRYTCNLAMSLYIIISISLSLTPLQVSSHVHNFGVLILDIHWLKKLFQPLDTLSIQFRDIPPSANGVVMSSDFLSLFNPFYPVLFERGIGGVVGRVWGGARSGRERRREGRGEGERGRKRKRRRRFWLKGEGGGGGGVIPEGFLRMFLGKERGGEKREGK